MAGWLRWGSEDGLWTAGSESLHHTVGEAGELGCGR